MKPFLLHIKDKIGFRKSEIHNRKFCPPHSFPHKLPFTKPITDEHCHIHSNKLRMLHHTLYCKLIKCPHYNFMIKKYKEHLKK